MDESAGSPSEPGGRPRSTISAPSAATIAPLSVHSAGRGTRSGRRPPAHRSLGHRAQPRVGRHAAPEHEVVHPALRHASTRLAREHVDDRLLERRGDVGDGHRLPGRLARLDPARHRGLQPAEGEVEAVPLQVAAAASARAGSRWRPVARRAAARSMRGPPGERQAEHAAPPCRRPRPPRRRWWRPSGRTSAVTSGTSSSDECPPETSSAMVGSGSGPCCSWSTATWAARWLTPYSGTPSASASAFAAATPTSSAPASPGPAVTATASTSRSRTPASAQRPLAASAPSPPGARGSPPPAPRRRSGRARRRCWRTRVGEQGRAADEPDPGLVARGLDAQHQRVRRGHAGPPLGRPRCAQVGRASRGRRPRGRSSRGAATRARSRAGRRAASAASLSARTSRNSRVQPPPRGLRRPAPAAAGRPDPRRGPRRDGDRLHVGLGRHRVQPGIADDAARVVGRTTYQRVSGTCASSPPELRRGPRRRAANSSRSSAATLGEVPPAQRPQRTGPGRPRRPSRRGHPLRGTRDGGVGPPQVQRRRRQQHAGAGRGGPAAVPRRASTAAGGHRAARTGSPASTAAATTRRASLRREARPPDARRRTRRDGPARRRRRRQPAGGRPRRRGRSTRGPAVRRPSAS